MPANSVVEGGHAAARLAESARTRSFLALGVDADHTGKAVETLTVRHGVECVDVTRVLVEAMREQARVVGLPWDTVRAADAAAPGTRDAAGLAALVQRALPAVDGAIERAMAGATDGSRPVLLVETAPLARYGHLGMLARWTDLALRRTHAVWLLVPQLAGTRGAVVDGKPLPLATPGQFVRLDAEWLGATMEGARP